MAVYISFEDRLKNVWNEKKITLQTGNNVKTLAGNLDLERYGVLDIW